MRAYKARGEDAAMAGFGEVRDMQTTVEAASGLIRWQEVEESEGFIMPAHSACAIVLLCMYDRSSHMFGPSAVVGCMMACELRHIY